MMSWPCEGWKQSSLVCCVLTYAGGLAAFTSSSYPALVMYLDRGSVMVPFGMLSSNVLYFLLFLFFFFFLYLSFFISGCDTFYFLNTSLLQCNRMCKLSIFNVENMMILYINIDPWTAITIKVTSIDHTESFILPLCFVLVWMFSLTW